jgi:hypothetical protein
MEGMKRAWWKVRCVEEGERAVSVVSIPTVQSGAKTRERAGNDLRLSECQGELRKAQRGGNMRGGMEGQMRTKCLVSCCSVG